MTYVATLESPPCKIAGRLPGRAIASRLVDVWEGPREEVDRSGARYCRRLRCRFIRLEFVGSRRGMTATANGERVVDPAELRRRLRACILELVPPKYDLLRAMLYQIVDHAPPAALRSMRDRLAELIT